MADFDKKIEILEIELEDINSKLENTKLEALIQLKVFIEEWFEKEARSIIVSNPSLSNSIGVERLKQIKQEVTELIHSVDELVETHLNVQYLWDYNYETGTGFYILGDKMPEKMNVTMRFVLGQLGKILSKDGFVNIKPTYGSNRQYDVWFDSATGKVKYPFSLNYPKELITTMKKYDELLRESSSKQSELKRIQKEKAETSVESIWDSL